MNNIEYLVKKDFEGKLIIIDKIDLSLIKDNLSKKTVVFLKTPSPDIILILDKIDGVIVDKGGRLSHFVIVCAENNLPVVKYDKANELKEGDYIIIKEGKLNVK
jgi:phosphoenolpyruvate-protein kinase (PTS system EI component)